MGRRRQKGRNINGILLLDKPNGMTSNAALQKVKWLFFAKKAGHTGSLDPLATGLLPICLGEATKISAYLLDSDKHYSVRIKLGKTTTTGDAEGEILESREVGDLTQEKLEAAIRSFEGDIEQVPPMYSALKQDGVRLYKLARQGVTVERPPRPVTIHRLALTQFDLPEFEMDVSCSKGTYVRTLAEDIGSFLGCGAHVTSLRRTGVGPFQGQRMVTLEALEAQREEDRYAMDELLLPLDYGLADLPKVELSADAAFYLKQGQAVFVANAPTGGRVRIYDHAALFLGIGEVQDDGKVGPKRLIQYADT